MKNTFTIQLNEKSTNVNNSCVVTYLGKKVVLPNNDERSIGLLFGEMIHRLVQVIVKVATVIKNIKFRKGLNEMKNFKKIKEVKKENTCLDYLYGYYSTYAHVDGFSEKVIR